MQVCIPLQGLVDKNTEMARVEKQISKLRKQHTVLANKLGNQRYCDNAPADVLAEEKARLAEWDGLLASYQEHLDNIAQLDQG
jgi:valyl-tRNA synthetase